jgi:hypothetical protein
MKIKYFQWGGIATVTVLALLAGSPLSAADNPDSDGTPPSANPAAPEGGLNDNAVHVMLTYAFSLVPNEKPGPDGKAVKVDKSDPNKFLIPDDDARRVIHAATRSAYADACGLPELAEANFEALVKSERAKNIWTEPQQLMINALYMFSASYFVGNVRDGDSATAKAQPGAGGAEASKGAAPAPGAAINAPQRPQCPPEKKQKVISAINAYVQAVQGAAPKAMPPAPPPAQPASSGAN